MDLRDKIKCGKSNKPLFFKCMYFFAWVCTLCLFGMYFNNPKIRLAMVYHPEMAEDLLLHPDTTLLLIAISLSAILLATSWAYYKKD